LRCCCVVNFCGFVFLWCEAREALSVALNDYTYPGLFVCQRYRKHPSFSQRHCKHVKAAQVFATKREPAFHHRSRAIRHAPPPGPRTWRTTRHATRLRRTRAGLGGVARAGGGGGGYLVLRGLRSAIPTIHDIEFGTKWHFSHKILATGTVPTTRWVDRHTHRPRECISQN
jgi:hypothetical protein